MNNKDAPGKNAAEGQAAKPLAISAGNTSDGSNETANGQPSQATQPLAISAGNTSDGQPSQATQPPAISDKSSERTVYQTRNVTSKDPNVVFESLPANPNDEVQKQNEIERILKATEAEVLGHYFLPSAEDERAMFRALCALVHPDKQQAQWVKRATDATAKLNNAHENFKIANLPEHNTRAVDDRQSRNYQKIPILKTAVAQLQHDPSDIISGWILSKWNSDQRERNRENKRELGTSTFPPYFLDVYKQAHDLRRQHRETTNETRKSELVQQFRNIHTETTAFCEEWKIPPSWAWQDQNIDEEHKSPPSSADHKGTEVTQAIDADSRGSQTARTDPTNDQNSNNRGSSLFGPSGDRGTSLFGPSGDRGNSLFLTSGEGSDANRGDHSSGDLMNIDPKSEGEADVKKETPESDEVPKGGEETNTDKSDPIDVDPKSPKEANMKKEFPKSHDIEGGDPSNPWAFTDNGQPIHKWRKCGAKGYQFIVQTGENKYEVLPGGTIGYKCAETFVKYAPKAAQIGYNDAEYTRAYAETFEMFMGVAYREPQTQSKERKKLPVTFAWGVFKDGTNEWLSRSVYRRILGHKYADDRITACCIDRGQTPPEKMPPKQWILKNMGKEILADKAQPIIEAESNNLVADAQKPGTIEPLSQSKDIVSNGPTEQTKPVSNEMRSDDQQRVEKLEAVVSQMSDQLHSMMVSMSQLVTAMGNNTQTPGV